MNIKFFSAKRAKNTYQYRNIKGKLYKANAAMWYKKAAAMYHSCMCSFDLLMMDGKTV